MTAAPKPPPNANACLMLADGRVFFGNAFGYQGEAVGEICFNTGMTGYQEVLTDPSYAGQIITFTFPHIGNVGCNPEDIESLTPVCAGLVVREPITSPSNFRSGQHLDAWLKEHRIPGISGVDTRALTRHIREKGAQNAAIVASGEWRVASEKLKTHPAMKGLDLAKSVTTKKSYEWTEGLWKLATKHLPLATRFHVVAIDYGEKLNILRSLAERGCKVTVVPAAAPAKDILGLKPHGVFLSNGPGDPAATNAYSGPVLRELIESGLPVFGICLGHQLLSLALGGKTEKMPQGHRGANHPVKNLLTGAVEITSQNHGFAVLPESLPEDCEITHVSLFDGTVEGFRHKNKPVFAVQYHPESSPGPHDSRYLFDQFVSLMGQHLR
jgi:carbamoyl-phosphate synthase small subunit